MRRERLRPAYSPSELAELYPEPHDSSRWRDHEVRVAVTIGLGRGFEDACSVGDLSAGDGRIARGIAAAIGIPDELVFLGDLAPGYDLEGPIERTLLAVPRVDLFICSETLEHLDDPLAILRGIRAKTDALVVSTPIEAWGDRGNPEHYWAWDREAVEAMLLEAGFEIEAFVALDLRPAWSPYCFGIWALR